MSQPLITTGFVVRYVKQSWDISANAVVPKQHKCNGFAALADDACEYLVMEKPENIPAVIMALAPGKPQEALCVYLAGKARGYFKGKLVSA